MRDTISKRLLFIAAAAIAAVTLGYTQFLASNIRKEEERKVKLWSEAVKQHEQLLDRTDKLLVSMEKAEEELANNLRFAYESLDCPEAEDCQSAFELAASLITQNKTVPVAVVGENGSFQCSSSLDTLLISPKEFMATSKAIPIATGQTIYYSESRELKNLRETKKDLKESFISETVINSASVPVLLVDASRTKIIRSQGIDTTGLSSPNALRDRLKEMESENAPIFVELPSSVNWVYFEESEVLTQLRYFPAVQLLLVGSFLLIAYLVFSASRRAEQNRVWVGMAKETAHQLGTPLSSLMAWSGLLSAKGVDPEALSEMDKDIARLKVVAERFSKIGSEAKLEWLNPMEVVADTTSYMRPRVSKHVDLILEAKDDNRETLVSQPLLSWVLENLIRNAVDAMDGKGVLVVRAAWGPEGFVLEVEDDGKGMTKSDARRVFEPGFTTKARGWGLGLSLAKRIVEQSHEGQLAVAWSELGKGTCFRITLPALEQPPS